MKKSLIFWFAAATCAAWILVGCESPTDGTAGAAGKPGPATLPADATPELLAAYFASTDKVFLVDDLDEGTFTVPAGKTLAVVGDVSLTNSSIIDAYEGTLDVALGTIDGNSGAVVIVAPAAAAAVTAKVSNASIPAYVASIPASPSAITVDTVLPGLTIGGSGTSATDFATFAGTSKTVYVKGNVTIDGTTAFDTSSAKLVVLGDTTAKGTFTAGATTKLGKLTASGTLTLSGVSQAEELDTATSTVTSTDTTVELDSLDSGTGGKLALTGNVTQVTIDSGTGNIEFNTGTPAFASSASNFGNTGLTTFASTSGISIATSFAGKVVFNGNVTVTGVAVTFNDTAFFKNGVVVTLADTSSAITLAGKTGALAVGAPSGAPDIYSTVLIGNDAATGGTLTATETNTTLTFATTGITQDVSSTGAHGITITGKVAAIPLKSYTVASASSKVGTLTVTGTLELDAGVLADYDDAPEGKPAKESDWVAKLVLAAGASGSNGALLKGAGKVIAGTGVEIIGGDNAWTASDSGSSGTTTVTIEAGKIAGSAATVSLKGTTSGQSITVLAGAELTIAANTIIDVSAAGSIVLTGANTDGAILTLADATAVINGGGSNGAVTTANITLIGSVGIADLTIGANVVFTDDATGNAFYTIKGAAASNSIQAIKDETDLTLVGTTTLTYT